MELITGFISIISVGVNLFLLYRVNGLFNEIDTLDSIIRNDRQYDLELTRNLLERLREIDIRGSFESDDEVGSIFTEITSSIERYNELINNY